MSRKTALATVRLLTLILLAICPAFSQSQDKVIEWMKNPFGNETKAVEARSRQIDIIEIEDVTVDGKSITLGNVFAADIDWIKRIGFRVRNVSPQPVSSIQIHLYLPEFTRPPYVDYCYGCANGVKALLPGEEVTVNGLLFYDWARDIIAGQGGDIKIISRALIRDIQIYQPGGTMFICTRNANQKSVCGSPSP
jgi:hypothetical protein